MDTATIRSKNPSLEQSRRLLPMILCFSLVALGALGCNRSTPPPAMGRAAQGQGGGLIDGGISLSAGIGAVFSTNDADYNQQIKNYVSATMDPAQFGHVASSLAEQERTQTGVRFYGIVALTANGYVDTNNSNMVLYIWDDMVGKTAPDGSTITAYVASFTRLSQAQVDNTRARLQFENDYTRIVLDGVYSSGIYEGTMSYETLVAIAGGARKSGNLGTFRIVTCEFFQCSAVQR